MYQWRTENNKNFNLNFHVDMKDLVIANFTLEMSVLPNCHFADVLT